MRWNDHIRTSEPLEPQTSPRQSRAPVGVRHTSRPRNHVVSVLSIARAHVENHRRVKFYDGECMCVLTARARQYDAPSHTLESLVSFVYEHDFGGFGDVVLTLTPRKLTVDAATTRFGGLHNLHLEVSLYGPPLKPREQLEEVRRETRRTTFRFHLFDESQHSR